MTEHPTPALGNEPAHFVRLLPGPDDECDLAGALLRILGLEIYEHQMVVLWRLRSVQDGVRLLDAIDKTLDSERDTDGPPGADRRGLPAVGRLLWENLRSTDDVGTVYTPTGGTLSGGLDELTGQTTVVPAVPPNASMLTVSVRDSVITLRLLIDDEER
jgi:hypothetical protein